MPIAESSKIYKQLQFATRRSDLLQRALRILTDANACADQLVALREDTAAELAGGEESVLTQEDMTEMLAAATAFKTQIEDEVLTRLATAIAP
jgi:hypothetical protein